MGKAQNDVIIAACLNAKPPSKLGGVAPKPFIYHGCRTVMRKLTQDDIYQNLLLAVVTPLEFLQIMDDSFLTKK